MDAHLTLDRAGDESPGVPRLELLLVLGTLALGAVLAIYDIVLPGSSSHTALIVLLLAAVVFNLLLLWLDWRHLASRQVVWGARLGDLAFLTGGIYLTGGFDSPFFALYSVYIAVASLRYGWAGARRSLILCLVCWLCLFVVVPPREPETWTHLGVDLGMFALITVAVAVLAQRRITSEHALVQRERELTFLRDAGRLMGTSLDPQQVLAVTLAQARELMDVEAASLALVDDTTGRVSLELVIGGADKAIEGLRLEPGQGIVGQVIETGEAILVPDAASDPRFFVNVDRLSGFRTRSLLCVPLCVEGCIIGALEVLNKRTKSFGEEDRRLLAALADLAAPAIQNARLHEQLRLNIERLQETYDEVQRLDELKSTFIRNISHELRTPLALIQGYLELILEGQLGDLQPEQSASLTVVSERAAALNRMVNDMISLQHISTLGYDVETLDMTGLIRSVADAAGPRAAKARVRLQLDLLPPEAVPPVRGDPARLRRALEHLVDNAIKFSPNGGVAQVIMGCEGDMLRIQVKDQGIGLATDQLEAVFERFYQVDGSATRRYGGTGLGLYLVKEIVEAHGGAVWAESEGIPGQGSTFSFFLPIYHPQPEA